MATEIREWETHQVTRGDVYDITVARKPAMNPAGSIDKYRRAIDSLDFVSVKEIKNLNDHFLVITVLFFENVTMGNTLKTIKVGEITYAPEVVIWRVKESGNSLLRAEELDKAGDFVYNFIGAGTEVVTSTAKEAKDVGKAVVDGARGIVTGVGLTGYALPLIVIVLVYVLAKNAPAIVEAVA